MHNRIHYEQSSHDISATTHTLSMIDTFFPSSQQHAIVDQHVFNIPCAGPVSLVSPVSSAGRESGVKFGVRFISEDFDGRDCLGHQSRGFMLSSWTNLRLVAMLDSQLGRSASPSRRSRKTV